MRVVSAKGSPFEIGRQIGSAARSLVNQAVALLGSPDTSNAERLERLQQIECLLEEAFPHLLEQMAGLAEGAEISRRQALELSVVSDLTGRPPLRCSLAAAPGNSGPLLAKNLDTMREMGPVQIVEQVQPEHGRAFAHVTTAGTMWTDGGVNDAGLGLVNASLSSSSIDPQGVPDGLLAREILARCSSVSDAIDLASSHGVRTMGENMLLTDDAGETVLLQKLPSGYGLQHGRTIAATNHVLISELADGMDPSDPIRDNSVRRLERLQDGLARYDEWSVDRLFDIMATEQHGVIQSGTNDLWTVATIAIDISARLLWVRDTLNAASVDAIYVDHHDD